MGAPRDLQFAGWELGIDNVHPPDHAVFQVGTGRDGAPVPARLVAALDLDLDDTGWPSTRDPAERVLSLAAGLGGWTVGARAFVQSGDTLYELNSGAPVALISGLRARIALAEHAGRIYLSDGGQHFELEGRQVRTWGLPVPAVALSAATGDLPAGRYLAQASWVDARGNEGGVSDLAAIELGAGQGIAVEVAPARAAVALRIYAGRAEQSTTSFAAEVPVGVVPVLSAGMLTTGDPPVTEQMSGPWQGIRGLCSWRAFLLVWRDNAVLRSEAQEPHLFHADSIMQFAGQVSVCVGMPGGLWVGTDEGLHWVAGEDPASWIPTRKLDAPVARGALRIQGQKLPMLKIADLAALFVTADGLVAGLSDGTALALTDGRYRFAGFSSSSRASFAYVERRDLRQLAISVGA